MLVVKWDIPEFYQRYPLGNKTAKDLVNHQNDFSELYEYYKLIGLPEYINKFLIDIKIAGSRLTGNFPAYYSSVKKHSTNLANQVLHAQSGRKGAGN